MATQTNSRSSMVDFLTTRRATDRATLEARWAVAEQAYADLQTLETRVGQGVVYVNAHKADAKARKLLGDLRVELARATRTYDDAFLAFTQAEEVYLQSCRECNLVGAPPEEA